MSQVSPMSPTRPSGALGGANSPRSARPSAMAGPRRDTENALDFVPADVASVRFRPSKSIRKSLPVPGGGSRRSKMADLSTPSNGSSRKWASVQFGSKRDGSDGGRSNLVETRNSSYLPTLRPPRHGSSAKVVRAEMEKRLTECGLDTHELHEHDARSVTLLLGSLSKEQEIYHSALSDVIASVSETLPAQAKLLIDIRDNYQLLFAKVPIQVQKITTDLGFERDLNAELLAKLRRARRAIRECAGEMETLLEGIAPTKTRASTAGPAIDATSSTAGPADTKFLAEIDSATAEESESATVLIKHLETLYEMQRGRLEGELDAARDMCDKWVTAADKLSQQLSDGATLETLGSLRLTSQCWIENARKIMSTVEARDSDLSQRIQLHVGEWKTHLNLINRMSQRTREVGLLTLRTVVREVKKMVKEQDAATGSQEKSTAWNRAMVLAERWVATLDKRQGHLHSQLPKGGVDRLERLCTSWSEIGDALFRCHKIPKRSKLREGLYSANDFERDAAAIAREHERFYTSTFATMDKFRETIGGWRSSSKVVNHEALTNDEFSQHIIAVHKIEKILQTAVEHLAAATKPSSQRDVPIAEWSGAMSDWLLRLEADVLSKNRTVTAQVKKVRRLFQEWTITAEMCAANVKGAHPMDALGKHSQLWTTVDEITNQITNSVDSVSEDTQVGAEFAVRETDLSLLRDQATEWNEQGRLVVDRLQVLHQERSGAGQVSEAAHRDEATTVQTPTRIGKLMEVQLPDEDVIRAILSDAKPQPSSESLSRLAQYLQKFVELEERKAIRNARQKKR
mmetsp:Transcript_26563/g.69875  ORF Transcript_26563/g.69875 Transcript_26563/m.69875 type:complete len:800 (-) Transcript_26563:923-3322(-)|eukprot:CAMPEP_0182953050 /NCGR_PEP_ID=MMETSP0105_2-20130417/62077_1 /TAXON_ID=81532 ORGANISM="Acanthoeca-like sp., Strain 10tr" /NCGR_SAMPLE_ID=MMETSP0105_2 /ASSEMBLY_ACC=CAM_ASM_000205 /LENGTH=799 /DNA_ID=CAMNT_0025093371 /DNA_START=177 /DNA_END=2576 /DNA_ORIENTATION=-